jgi:phospholipid/cholesterol/gamma-HCH transport system substrate-binding protein
VAKPAFAELRQVAPLAVGTVETGSAAAPSITRFLASARPFMTQLSPVLKRSAPMLGCIRPYAPELAGFASTWSSFSQNQDAASHYARVHVVFGPTNANGAPLSDQQMLTLTPGLTYAFPRVPGLNSGQPWFIPACGYTPASLNPALDPEAHK